MQLVSTLLSASNYSFTNYTLSFRPKPFLVQCVLISSTLHVILTPIIISFGQVAQPPVLASMSLSLEAKGQLIQRILSFHSGIYYQDISLTTKNDTVLNSMGQPSSFGN